MRGKDQVEKVAKELGEMRFDAIYASEFLRARESAAIMAKGRNLRVKIDKRLNELKTGFEGEPVEVYYSAREKSGDIVNFKVEKGESFMDVKKRVYEFLEDLRKKKYARVLIVTHEAVVMAARAVFGELSDEDAFMTKVGNAEYFMFDM